MRMTLIGSVALLVLACLCSAQTPITPGNITVASIPKTPRIEHGRVGMHMHSDFRITNGAGAVTLWEIELWVYAADGGLIQRRKLNANGTAPGINVVRNLTMPIAAGSTVHFFNPFHTFESDLDLNNMVFRFTFLDGRGNKIVSSTAVAPNRAPTKTQHVLPLRGRVLVRDGHDTLSHHRRVSFDHPGVKALKFKGNSGRFALDLVVVDDIGNEYNSTGLQLEDWHGYGVPVYSPAAGRIVHVVNNVADNSFLPGGGIKRPPGITTPTRDSLPGNFVVVDFGDGEFGMLAHLKKGTVTVSVGDEVKQGEQIAQLGLSGASDHVHLHYQMQNGSDIWESEGLPAYFVGFDRELGATSKSVSEPTAIDSGDILTLVPSESPEIGRRP